MRPRHWWYTIPLRVRSLVRRSRVERDLDEELRFHLENQIDEYIAKGLSPEDARCAARRVFGGVEQHKEACRDQRRLRPLDELVQDVRYAVRGLRKSPGFAAAAIATLALGIGANTAIFSIIHAVLLRPLPYANPDSLYAVHTFFPRFSDKYPEGLGVRVRELLGWPQTAIGVTQIAGVTGASFNLTGNGEPERIGAVQVSTNIFSLLGAQPAIGRGFLAGEEQLGRNRVVVISHEFWTRRFAADPGILQRSLLLNGEPYRVVGILPPHFPFPAGEEMHSEVPLPTSIDVWTPLALSPQEMHRTDGAFDYGVIIRLKQGVAAEQARKELEAITQRDWRQDFLPNQHVSDLEIHVKMLPIREIFSGKVRLGLVVISCAAALLLLIACVNIASLLLARAIHRWNEFGIRLALGAGRWRLMRQLLTESLLLSTLGGATGILLATWGIRVLIARGPAELPFLQQIGVNDPVLAFSLGMILLTGIAVGLAPACQVFGMSVGRTLTTGARGPSTGAAAERLRQLLVGVEVALSTILLVTAGLLLHSFAKLMGVDKGCRVERIVCMDLVLPQQYAERARCTPFYRDLLERIRTFPTVMAADAISALPLTSEPPGSPVYTEGETRFGDEMASYNVSSPGYLAAVGIPLLAGRFPGEREAVPAVAISAKLARLLWPRQALGAAVGRRIRYGWPTAPLWTIVGITGDVKFGTLERESLPQVYRPYDQEPQRAMSIVIRTSSGDMHALASALRELVHQRDRNLPILDLRTMTEVISASVAQRRFQISLVSLFAMAALVLALVGIYGVVSYSVACRTRDIGLRIALGSSPEDVLRSVLLKGLRPVALGLVCGTTGAVAAAFAFRSLLFGIVPIDPVAIGGVTLLLLAASTAACYVPARRASRLDPAAALRCD